MSAVGVDNESASQRRKLNKENKKATAKGNKPVASVKGGGNDAPQMRSVNEPQIVNPMVPQVDNTVPRIMDNEQMALRNSNVVAQQMDVNPQTQAVVQNQAKPIVTTADKVTAARKAIEEANNPQYKQYEYTDFDRQKDGYDIAKNDLSFQDMLNMVRQQTLDAEEKSKKASKYAKASAWGNFFHALGQLAGAGKNVYIKPDSKYLQSALAKADEARNAYDKIKAANDRYLKDAETAYVDKLEAQHNAKEKMKADTINKYNITLQKDKAKQADLAYKAQKDALDNALKAGKLKVDEYNAETNRLKLNYQKEQNANKKEAATAKAKQKYIDDAYLSFVDYDNGNTPYYFNESRALDIANIMIKDFGMDEQALGLLESNIKGTLEIKDKAKLKSSILSFLKTNKDYSEVKKILNYVKGEEDRFMGGAASYASDGAGTFDSGEFTF